jgi:Bacterial membrane protein YfhO
MNPTFLYVAAVYAIAVWLARRAGVVELRWRIAAFFYLLVLIFLWQPMTGAWVNLPVDIVGILPPWSGWLPKRRIANFEMNDIAMQIVPWAHQAREAWKSLTLPLWNSQSGCGYPLLANAQSSAFSPIRLLALPLPLGYAMTAEAAWKILIALTFTFLYCRRRGWGELPSAIGAVCFGWCTFVQTWLHFPLVTVAVWIPAAFLTTDLLLEKVTWPRFLTATGVWVVMLFGGHPETVSHTAFFIGLYVLWAAGRQWRNAIAIPAAIAVAALIAAPFIAPFAEAITKSKRFQELQVRPNEIGYYSDLPSEVILFQPQFFGHVPNERPWGPAVAESITGFAGIVGVAAWFAIVLRAIVRRRFRDRELFFVIGTLIVLGIILAWPGVSDAFHLIFKLAANARLRLMLCWMLAAMTAAALDAVLRDRAVFLLAGGLAAALMLLWCMTKMPFPGELEKSAAMMAILPSMIVLLVSTLLATRWREAAMMLVGVAVIAELWAASEGWNPTLPKELMYPSTPLTAKLEELQRGWARAPFRVAGLGPAFFPNAHALYGVEDVRVHDPMANGRYVGFLRTTFGLNTDDYFMKWDDPDTRVLDLTNARYVVTDPRYEMKDAQRYALVYRGKDGRIYENRDVMPRFWAAQNIVLEFKGDKFVDKLAHHTDWAHTAIVKVLPVIDDRMRQDLLAPRPASSPQASVRITSAQPTDFRVHVSAPRWTLIVSSIPWWPGWHVTRNGREIEPQPVNGPFLGWTVPPGETEIRVWYAPATFYGGAAASLVTVAALAALATRSRLRRRRAEAR